MGLAARLGCPWGGGAAASDLFQSEPVRLIWVRKAPQFGQCVSEMKSSSSLMGSAQNAEASG